MQTFRSTAFSTTPDLLRTLLQNGLVVGILLAMLLEHTLDWDRIK